MNIKVLICNTNKVLEHSTTKHVANSTHVANPKPTTPVRERTKKKSGNIAIKLGILGLATLLVCYILYSGTEDITTPSQNNIPIQSSRILPPPKCQICNQESCTTCTNEQNPQTNLIDDNQGNFIQENSFYSSINAQHNITTELNDSISLDIDRINILSSDSNKNKPITTTKILPLSLNVKQKPTEDTHQFAMKIKSLYDNVKDCVNSFYEQHTTPLECINKIKPQATILKYITYIIDYKNTLPCDNIEPGFLQKLEGFTKFMNQTQITSNKDMNYKKFTQEIAQIYNMVNGENYKYWLTLSWTERDQAKRAKQQPTCTDRKNISMTVLQPSNDTKQQTRRASTVLLPGLSNNSRRGSTSTTIQPFSTKLSNPNTSLNKARATSKNKKGITSNNISTTSIKN